VTAKKAAIAAAFLLKFRVQALACALFAA